ncbi:MAG: hypothetical protein ACRC2M_25115, partial [Planktothrix sp.]
MKPQRQNPLNNIVFQVLNQQTIQLNHMAVSYSSSFCRTLLIQLPFAFLVFLFSCSKEADTTPSPVVIPPLTGTPEISITTLLTNQGMIWGFDVLPNGNL